MLSTPIQQPFLASPKIEVYAREQVWRTYPAKQMMILLNLKGRKVRLQRPRKRYDDFVRREAFLLPTVFGTLPGQILSISTIKVEILGLICIKFLYASTTVLRNVQAEESRVALSKT
jgi:hypothetical protein